MNKFLGIVVLLLVIAGPSAILYGDEGVTKSDVAAGSVASGDITSYRLDVGDKFARGTKNFIFGWTEIPKRMIDITDKTGDPVQGAFLGMFQGTLKAMARTFSGASDMLTAPITPEKGPLISPEIAVE